MTLSQNGINYICQNFGNSSKCCVDSGLSWYYTSGGSNTNETGATAQIVGRLALGLIDSLTMTNPARGTFTQAQLNTANGSAVSISDAQIITSHDNPADSGGQWCYSPPVTCSSYTSQSTCELNNCFWWNGSCHDSAPTCTSLNNQTDCTRYGCYWYDGSCHSTPQELICEDYITQADCVANGCYWYNNSCHSEPYIPPNGDCEDYTTEASCKAAGCHWYAHPNPFGTPSCHGQDMVISYLPFIAVGIGIFALIVLISKRGSDYPPTIINR